MDTWPPYTEHVFSCSCGEQIGVCQWPNRSVEDGRDLGTSYLALAPKSLSSAVSLWKVGTGDAGHFNQCCPKCNAPLVQPAAQTSLL